MSTILVPPEVLLSVSEQFNRASNQLEANSNTLNQHIQMLASCWDGTTCSRFYYDFQQAYRDMKLTIEHMQVTSQELKKIAYKFMQVDNEQGNLDPRCASPQTLNSLGMSNVHYEKAIKQKSFGDHVNELGMEMKAFGVGVQAAAAEMWDSAKDTANALIEEPIETGKQMAYNATIGTAEEIVKTTIWGAKMALDIGDTREKFGEEIQAEQELINEMGTSTYLGQQAAMIFGGFALKRLGVKDTPNLKKDSGGEGGKGKAAEGTPKADLGKIRETAPDYYKELIDKYGDKGRYYARSPEDYESLAKDPAKNFKINEKSKIERLAGLELEARGDLPGPIVRDTNPAGAEFIDVAGVKWDVKGWYSKFAPKGYTLEKAIADIEESLSKGENVIIDSSKMSPEHINEVREAVKELGLSDKLLWWP